MTEKLDHKLEQVEIKQTRSEIEPIRFKDEAINKVRKENYVFGKRLNLFIPFIVSKDSHQRGLKLRIYKGGGKATRKVFYVQYWFNGRSDIEHLKTFPHPRNPGKRVNLTHKLERKDSKKC